MESDPLEYNMNGNNTRSVILVHPITFYFTHFNTHLILGVSFTNMV